MDLNDGVSGSHDEISALEGRVGRMRQALMGLGPLFAAARHPDPLPVLSELVANLLGAESVEILVPAPTAAGPDDPRRIECPIVIGRRPVGQITAVRSQPFDADDRALAVGLGPILGIVLDQASLVSQIEQYRTQIQANADTLDSLLEVSRQVIGGSTDLRSIGVRLVSSVPQMVGGERASLLLMPVSYAQEPILVLNNGTVASGERARALRDQGLAGLVLRERRPVIIDETETDQRWLALQVRDTGTSTRCAMAVPLLWGGSVIGALTVTTTQSHLFDAPQLALLELVAGYIALLIHSAEIEAQVRCLSANAAEAGAQVAAAISAISQSLEAVPGQSPAAVTLRASLAHLQDAERRIKEAQQALGTFMVSAGQVAA